MRKSSPFPVMLFAAGFGTRMRPLRTALPKPLVPVGGQALIDHALGLVRDYGAERIVANLHYLPDQIERHLAGQGIVFSREEPEILDTGGGLRAALPYLGEGPVMTLNTDAVWCGSNPLRLLSESWDPARMDALLLCIPRAQALGHDGSGDFLIDSEFRAERGPGLVYSGLEIIKTERLAEIAEPRFSLNLLWDKLLAERRLFGIAYGGKWCDVGRPESIVIANEMLADCDV